MQGTHRDWNSIDAKWITGMRCWAMAHQFSNSAVKTSRYLKDRLR